MLYKIINNNKVVDVVQKPRFLRFLTTGHVALSDKSSANGIVGSDDSTLYSFKPVNRKGVKIVTIEKITLEEFNRLKSLLNSGQEPSADESFLANAKRDTIKRLSNICSTKITSGFSIILSDGKEYNFKLTQEDQLNLLALENQLNAGATTFLYHATGQPCRFFSKEDMAKILNTFRRHILYHTTYFNVAKQYINAQVNIEKVNLFTYGMDVSSAVDDIVIKQILKNGGDF
jgi:hypothetical protein